MKLKFKNTVCSTSHKETSSLTQVTIFFNTPHNYKRYAPVKMR